MTEWIASSNLQMTLIIRYNYVVKDFAPNRSKVILHDAGSDRWLSFSNPIGIVTAETLSEIPAALEAVEAANAKGNYAAGFICYEAAPAFDLALVAHKPGSLPLLWFGIYDSAAEVPAPESPDEGQFNVSAWKPSISQEEYNTAIQRIKDYIASGDTYQVNFTMRLLADYSGDSKAFFDALCLSQRADYCAYLDIGDHVICSASPELFFKKEGNRITCKPMKGTVGRGLTSIEDEANAEWLHHSEKNRAENVMIVDMIRNDLGRIAVPGSVKTVSLYNVERYDTLWQMTSTVTAESSISLSEIFNALFPCASITGAPKVRTCQIIKELEHTPRGIYTGCIGFIAPNGDAQFNVAIRTVHLDKRNGKLEYGIGGGITWDSNAEEEYRECQTKALVLTARRPPFQLLETILWDPMGGRESSRAANLAEGDSSSSGGRWSLTAENREGESPLEPPISPQAIPFSITGGQQSLAAESKILNEAGRRPKILKSKIQNSSGYFLLDLHLQRLTASARYFSIPLDIMAVKTHLKKLAEGFPSEPQRVRLLVDEAGIISTDAAPFSPAANPLWRVAIAREPIEMNDYFMYHKTTHRAVYEKARAAAPGFDDVLLWNSRGEITESTIANIVIRKDGCLYTPPVSCGLLPGTFRAHLLEAGEIEEKIVTPQELNDADEIFLINSLRGWIPVTLGRGV